MEIQNIQSAMAGISRLKEFFAHLVEEQGSTADLNFTAPPLVIDDASFSYGRENVFRNLSLAVKKGETVTITGRTGSGKSTLFKLILGLYAPQEGSIRVFGCEPSRLAPSVRRQVFGYVEQQFHDVAGTISVSYTHLTLPTILLV